MYNICLRKHFTERTSKQVSSLVVFVLVCAENDGMWI